MLNGLNFDVHKKSHLLASGHCDLRGGMYPSIGSILAYKSTIVTLSLNISFLMIKPII